MRKLLIHLIDGITIERDLYKAGIPLTLPANSENYLLIAAEIAKTGVVLSGDAKSLRFIPPSQIKLIEIVFDTPAPPKSFHYNNPGQA